MVDLRGTAMNTCYKAVCNECSHSFLVDGGNHHKSLSCPACGARISPQRIYAVSHKMVSSATRGGGGASAEEKKVLNKDANCDDLTDKFLLACGNDDYELAASMLENIDTKSAKVLKELYHMYFCGEGVAQDWTIANRYLAKGAELGYADMQCSLGREYSGGCGGLKKDIPQARYWFEKCSRSNDEVYSASAMISLAETYEDEGKYSDAKKWCLRAMMKNEWYRKDAALKWLKLSLLQCLKPLICLIAILVGVACGQEIANKCNDNKAAQQMAGRFYSAICHGDYDEFKSALVCITPDKALSGAQLLSDDKALLDRQTAVLWRNLKDANFSTPYFCCMVSCATKGDDKMLIYSITCLESHKTLSVALIKLNGNWKVAYVSPEGN